MLGRPVTRNGFLTVDPPVGVVAGTAFVAFGTVAPNGAPVDVAIVPGQDTAGPPDDGWAPVFYSDAAGKWAYNLTADAPGTHVIWVRLRDHPRTAVPSAPFTAS